MVGFEDRMRWRVQLKLNAEVGTQVDSKLRRQVVNEG
jgi:hypothetical protein